MPILKAIGAAERNGAGTRDKVGTGEPLPGSDDAIFPGAVVVAWIQLSQMVTPDVDATVDRSAVLARKTLGLLLLSSPSLF